MAGDLLVHPPLRDEELGFIREALVRPAEVRGGPPSVTIGVSGGAPSERYLLMVRLDGDGKAEYRFMDELAGTQVRQTSFETSPEETARIFEMVHPFVDTTPRPLFEADSLVGFVTVRAGSLECQTVFPVWEADAGEPSAIQELPTPEQSLRVNPGMVPEGVTTLFSELNALIERSVTPAPA